MLKRHILTIILLAWFVGIRAPHSIVPGAWMSMVVGPFPSLALCQRQQALLEAIAEDMPGAVVTDCKETI